MDGLTKYERELVREGLAEVYRGRLVPIVKGGMAPIYGAMTGGAVALSAATAKTVIGAKAHANSGLLLKKLRLGFDGVTGTAVPVLVEIGSCSFGANSPGTNSTSITPVQRGGRVITVGFTAGKTWTTEPTTITVVDELLVPGFMGDYWMDIPLGDEYDFDVSTGPVVRCTAPAAVNVRASMELARC